MNLTISSKGLFSSWGYYAPHRILFDCGEGCATALGNEVFAPRFIFLSHGHHDHITGVPSFVSCRCAARGDKKKPVELFRPADPVIDQLLEFVRSTIPYREFELNDHMISPGFFLELGNNCRVEAFAVQHCANSLGYRIVEARSRLLPTVPPSEVRARLAAGATKASLMETYHAVKFAWTLDSFRYDPALIQLCEWLVADTTFLNPGDRDSETHADVMSVIRMAAENRVARLTLAHFSPRYQSREVTQAVASQVEAHCFRGTVDVISSEGGVHQLE